MPAASRSESCSTAFRADPRRWPRAARVLLALVFGSIALASVLLLLRATIQGLSIESPPHVQVNSTDLDSAGSDGLVRATLVSSSGEASVSLRRAGQPPVVDFISVAVKPSCVAQRTVANLNLHIKPRTIHIVTSRPQQCGIFRSMADNVACHDEDTLVPGLTRADVRDFLQRLMGTDPDSLLAGRSVTGWYYQQLLKLGAVHSSILDLPDYYVVWDIDMIPMRNFDLFLWDDATGDWRTRINVGGYKYDGYRSSYSRLTRHLGLGPVMYGPDKSSLVVHHMVVARDKMLAFLQDISTDADVAVAGALGWVRAVLRSVDAAHVKIGFSEYWSYHSYLLARWPESVFLMRSRTWARLTAPRPVMLPDGLSVCCPTAPLLSLTRYRQLDYLGYEAGHQADVCNYNHPRFNETYMIDFVDVPKRPVSAPRIHMPRPEYNHEQGSSM